MDQRNDLVLDFLPAEETVASPRSYHTVENTSSGSSDDEYVFDIYGDDDEIAILKVNYFKDNEEEEEYSDQF